MSVFYRGIRVLPVESSVPHVQAHVYGHQDDVQDVECDDIVDLVIDDFVGDAEEISYLDDHLEDYALPSGRPGQVGACDVERP